MNRFETFGRVAVSVAVAAATVVLSGSAGPGAAPARGARVAEPLTDPGGPLELLPLQTADRRIVDSAGRDVLLRGANVNSFAEYWQGVPALPTTIPISDTDWDLMASRGFSVVRLLITWSRVEPARGAIDHAYLDQVEAAVEAAARRGIYTVIDMHQDAYSATIATTDPASCPAGTAPAKGWDGAPAWATLTDGLSTCLRGSDRNSSPAVERAWNNFYDDVDGIRGRFVAAWAAVAGRFAGRPEVAGYDILNEPEVSRPSAALQPIYDDLLADAIGAIRAAESDAPFDHVVFVEPAIPAGEQSRGLVIPSPAALDGDTANISASVHNYMESITDQLTLEAMNDLIETLTLGLGVANWGGEYGFWDTRPETLATARRYAADEDDHRWGGAWWQWRQSCGDPHAVQWRDGEVVAPGDPSTHLNLLGCPGNVDLGPNDAFLDIVGRGYPRATPGRLDTVSSDLETGELEVRGTAPVGGGRLVVWTPTDDDPDHRVSTDGLTDVVAHPVQGGRIISATVAGAGSYLLRISPGEPTAPPPSPTTTTTTTTTTTDPGTAPGPTSTPASTSTTPPVSTTHPIPATTAPGTPTTATTRPGSASGPPPPARPASPARPRRASPAYTG
jgi:endoglycosylceramidase